MICSSCRTRWLTALGVTNNSSAACVTLRSRASASKVSRHWMGGMRLAPPSALEAVLFELAMRRFLGCRGLFKDDRLVAVEQHAVFAVPLQGTRQHLAFGVAAHGGQVFHGAAVLYTGHVLLDDRAFVQV